MAVVVKPKRYSLDFMAMRLFVKIIKLLGGPRKMIELKRVTWLPSLMGAVYVVLLHEIERKTTKKIAATLGLTPQTVQNILRAKPEFARQLWLAPWLNWLTRKHSFRKRRRKLREWGIHFSSS